MEKIGDIKKFQIPSSIVLFAALVIECPSYLQISLVSACSLSCSTSLLAAFSPYASLEASLAPSFSLSTGPVLHAYFYTKIIADYRRLPTQAIENEAIPQEASNED